MNIERNVNNVDGGDVFYVESQGDNSPSGSRRKWNFRRLFPFFVTAIFAAAITLGVVKYTTPQHFGLQFALQATSGKIALTLAQLRAVVVGEGLTVYWLGPEDGALYSLVSVNSNQTYLRYLPGGAGLNDVGANFRVIGTYKAKDAFSITQNDSSQLVDGASGFTNADGDAVSYNTITHPLSAYVGLKNTDYQIEIFDPVAGQAVIAARTLGLIQKIR